MKFLAGRFAVLTAVILTSPLAMAGYVLDLRYDDNTTSKLVNSGDILKVNLLLTESAPDHVMFDEGLVGGGGRVTFAGTAGAVLSNTTVNPGFDAAPVIPPAALAGEIAAILATVDFFSPAVGVGLSTIQIAQFEFTVSGGAGQTGAFTSAVLGGLDVGNITFGDGITPGSETELDALISNFGGVDFTINGAAVPEPTTMILGGLTAFGAGCVGFRRRRSSSAVDVAG